MTTLLLAKRPLRRLVKEFCDAVGNDYKWYLQNIRKIGSIWGIEQDSDLVGFCHAYVCHEFDRQEPVCVVTGLYVRPEARNVKNLADFERLVRRVRGYAQRFGCRKTYMMAKKSKGWAKLGFRSVGGVYELV